MSITHAPTNAPFSSRRDFFASLFGAGALAVRDPARALGGVSAETVDGCLNVKDAKYGAKGDGSDATVAFRALLRDMSAGPTRCGYVPDGIYVVDELVLGDFQVLRGAGRGTTLIAKTDAQTIIRMAGSHGGVADLQFTAVNGTTQRSGVTGLAVCPATEDMPNTTLVNQNHNRFQNLYFGGGLENGIRMRCGAPVGGAASGCWYNQFENVQITYCQRGLWIQQSTFDGVGASGVNRNRFFGLDIGAGGSNTGVQIDDGEGNLFFGAAFEGIEAGQAPSSPATAIRIAAMGRRYANNDNRFFGATFEANAQDIDNSNNSTQFYGVSGALASKVKNNGGVSYGGVCIGAHPSEMPLLLPSIGYGEGVHNVSSGQFGLGKDLEATGGYRQVLAFRYADIAAGLNDAWCDTVAGSSFPKGYTMVRPGSVTGVSIACSTPATRGSLTARVTVNGTAFPGPAAQIGPAGSSGQNQYALGTLPKDTRVFAERDRLGVVITSSGNWAPGKADLIILLEIET